MLVQRVITAIVLLAVLLGALLAPGPWPLVTLLAIAAVCALWEWLRLTWPRKPSFMPLMAALVLLVFIVALAMQWLAPVVPSWATDIQLIVNRWLMTLVTLIWVLG